MAEEFLVTWVDLDGIDIRSALFDSGGATIEPIPVATDLAQAAPLQSAVGTAFSHTSGAHLVIWSAPSDEEPDDLELYTRVLAWQ